MMSGGIDGIGGSGGGRFIAPPGGGGTPPPGGPGGPNGPGDDGDDKIKKKKEVTREPDTLVTLSSPSEMIRQMHAMHCGSERYARMSHAEPRRPSIETLDWLGAQDSLTDDDRRMLTEIREDVVREEALLVHRKQKRIEDVHDGIREQVAAALAGIIAYLAQIPPADKNPPPRSDDFVKGVEGSGGGGMNPDDGGDDHPDTPEQGNDDGGKDPDDGDPKTDK